MTYERDQIESVSGAISNLTYGEMVALARTLTDMANDREEFRSGQLQPMAIADLLWDWSEAVEGEIEQSKDD